MNEQPPDGQARQHQSETELAPIPIEIIEAEASADSRKRHEAEARQCEIDDLIAQQRMADATKAMEYYSYVQTRIVAVGTFFVFASLVLMFCANRAAVAAVKVTRDIGIRQLRAYIAVEPCGVQIISDPPSQAIATVGIRNVGNTPANNVGWAIWTDVSDDKRRRDFPVSDDVVEGCNSVPPGAVMLQGSQQFSGAAMTYARGMGSKRWSEEGYEIQYLYVWGVVLYNDGFEKKLRRTKFCHRYNCINTRGSRIRPHFGRFHRYGNEAD